MAIQLKVSSIVCSSCADSVTKAIQKLDNQAQVRVDLETKMVTIESQISPSLIQEAIEGIGHIIEV